MWIPNTTDWHESHTELSKYFIERLKQKVDPSEIISNRHRTSNGYTFIAEIISVAENSLKRERTISRLVSLIDEATCVDLHFTIPNDFVLAKHFPDIAQYYQSLNRSLIKDSSNSIRSLIIKSKIFLKRLEVGYYEKLGDEIGLINFDSGEFNRNAARIDQIIDCLVPYLLFNGYSTTSIDEISYRYVFKDNALNSAKRIFRHFNGYISEYRILIKYWTSALEMEGILSFFKEKGIESKHVEFDDVKDDLKRIKDFKVSKGEALIEVRHSSIDPHNFIREIYDRGLKKYVGSADRLELGYFTHFLDSVYWRFSKAVGEKRHLYNSTNIYLDPINVPNRGSTLRYTLSRVTSEWPSPYRLEGKLPDIAVLAQSTYFYNLALGSKSIENSLFLLWTCLETLVPYRLHKSDINNVQHFVASSLGFGAILRELSSFIVRVIETNKQNKNIFKDFEIKTKYFNHSVSSLVKWAEWLGVEYGVGDPNDPFSKIQSVSNLLCRQYCFLNELYTGKHKVHRNANYWLAKIQASELAIAYQLDRIYLHRNQIVHSGKFLNEYSNLWSHLEWYVGKLLSYAYLYYMRAPESASLEEIFMKLESDSQEIKNIIKTHSNKPIRELESSYPIIFQHTWQSF